MFSYQMHWDGIIDHDGYKEIRFGIHIIVAENNEDAIRRAKNFFNCGTFIDYTALLEGNNFICEIEQD